MSATVILDPRTGKKRRFKSYNAAKSYLARAANSPSLNTQMPFYRRGYDRTAGYYGRPSGEFKFRDTTFLSIFPPSGRVFATGPEEAIRGPGLCAIQSGTGESERIGRKIAIHKLFAKFIVEKMEEDIDAIAADTGQTYRIVIFQDKQTNGDPIVDSRLIYTQWNANDGVSVDEQSTLGFRVLSNAQRFRILWDSGLVDHNQVVYKSTGDAGDQSFGRINKSHEVWLNFKKPITIEYSGTTGGDAEIRTNNIGYVFYKDAKEFPINIRSSLRIKYTDV